MIVTLLSDLLTKAIHIFDITFGAMSPKEVLWTIIGLLALYQLIMIKWRLIDQARANRTQRSFMMMLRRRQIRQIFSTRRRMQTTPEFMSTHHDDSHLREHAQNGSQPMASASASGRSDIAQS